MKEKLTILYNYLKNNDHMQDANRIAKILDEYDKNGDLSELSIKKIKAMCNPRYLGNLYIKEFPRYLDRKSTRLNSSHRT